MLYPGAPIRQAEAMWADMEQASDQAPVGPRESPNILLRLFLFFSVLRFRHLAGGLAPARWQTPWMTGKSQVLLRDRSALFPIAVSIN